MNSNRHINTDSGSSLFIPKELLLIDVMLNIKQILATTTSALATTSLPASRVSQGNNLFLDYASQCLNQIRSKLNVNLSSAEIDQYQPYEQVRPAIINHIKCHQFDKRYNITTHKITPKLSYSTSECQLPQSPSTLHEIPDYALNLMRRGDIELTQQNKVKRSELMNSLSEILDKKGESTAQFDDPEQILPKCVLLHQIAYSGTPNLLLFESLKCDRDVFYLAMFLYYINPYKLEKYGRLNQVLRIIESSVLGNGSIVEDDWLLFESLVMGNNLTNAKLRNLDKKESSVVLTKLESILIEVNKSYYEYDLVDMLRHLRNAETGYEMELEGVNQVLKFGIGYYRYLLIERAANEWTRDFLRPETWERHNLAEQWRIICNVYYESENIEPPGGAAMKRRVQGIIKTQSS